MVLGATVDFGLSLLTAEPLHLTDGQTLHAQRREGLAHVVELEGLDDGYDQLHVAALLPRCLAWRTRETRRGCVGAPC